MQGEIIAAVELQPFTCPVISTKDTISWAMTLCKPTLTSFSHDEIYHEDEGSYSHDSKFNKYKINVNNTTTMFYLALVSGNPVHLNVENYESLRWTKCYLITFLPSKGSNSLSMILSGCSACDGKPLAISAIIDIEFWKYKSIYKIKAFTECHYMYITDINLFYNELKVTKNTQKNYWT